MILRRSLFFRPGLNCFQIRRQVLRGIQTSPSKIAPSASSNEKSPPSTSAKATLSPPTLVPNRPSHDIKSSPLGKVDSATLQSQEAPAIPNSQTKGAIDSDEIPSRTRRPPDDLTKNQHLVTSLSKVARISAKLLEQSQSWNAQLQHIRNFTVTEPGLQRTALENAALKAATLDVKKECEQIIETLLAVRRNLVTRLEILHPVVRHIKTTSLGETIGSELETGRVAAEQVSPSDKTSLPLKEVNIIEKKDLQEKQETRWRMRTEAHNIPTATENKTEGRRRTQDEAWSETNREVFGDETQAGDLDWFVGKPGRLHEVHKKIKERMDSESAQDQSSPP